MIENKISFALDQNGTGSGIKIIQGVNKPQTEGFLQPQKAGGRNGDSHILQGIKKIDEHRLRTSLNWSFLLIF